MKLRTFHPIFRNARPSKRTGAFTLPELLVAITVFTMLLGGIVFAHLFGLSMFQITETKLNATADARKIIGTMANEIRACDSIEVGNIAGGEFVGLLDGEKQHGTSLCIYPNGNTNSHIIYFVDPSNKSFKRTTSKPGSAVIIAEQVTNSVVFSAQDILGNVLTNNTKNRVIHMNLEFYQAARHLQGADYYKLETSVTRRSSD